MNKTFIKTCSYTGVIVLMLVSATAVYAQAPVACGEEGRSHGMKRTGNLVEELDLTPEQQERMKVLRQENKEKRKLLQQELEKNREALKEELGKYRSDPAAIDTTVARIKDVQARLIDYRVDRFLQMKRILSREQFEKMSQMKGQRKTGRWGRKKRRRFL